MPQGKRRRLSGIQRKLVKMPWFKDSKVIIGSSKGDIRVRQSSALGLSGYTVIRSSPPVIDWPLGSSTSYRQHVEELAQPTSDLFSSDLFSSLVRKFIGRPVSILAV